ncbi:uncharacterized protein LOC106064896 [Biomphalaria glabrata]|uniref:Uncharacterized protein LOC106064896 n=1 Tax=Biomphalaria glabrata TaxID=6526 RepID=A0A9W2Z1E1_BIOGL|nr:uncharacterized protein LOC106064896 [Biomphalaria glabrata]XP_055868866.1 uncharacterized protein LOC106064896 [Biomphalaria glabrata]
MTTVAAPSELPDVPECPIDSQTSVDDRRMRWVEFFDREKYLQHVLLMRSRQFSALVQLLQTCKKETDPFRPPVELPVPEQILAPTPPPQTAAEEDEAAVTHSDLSSHSKASQNSSLSSSSSSCYTTTKSRGTSYVSVRSVDARKTNTIALVILVVSVLVIAGIIVGIVVHIHVDTGLLGSSENNKESHKNTNWMTSKERDHIHQLVTENLSPHRTLDMQEYDEVHSNNYPFSSKSPQSATNDLRTSLKANDVHITRSSADSDSTHNQLARDRSNQNTSGRNDSLQSFNQMSQSEPGIDRLPTDQGHTKLGDDLSPITRGHTDFSNLHMSVSRSNLDGVSLSRKTTYPIDRSESPTSAMSSSTSQGGTLTSSMSSSSTSESGIPIATTFDPLNPQGNNQPESAEPNLGSPDSGSNPYLRVTGRFEELNSNGDIHEQTSVTRNSFSRPRGANGSTGNTLDPMPTSREQQGTFSRYYQLTNALSLDLTTMPTDHQATDTRNTQQHTISTFSLGRGLSGSTLSHNAVSSAKATQLPFPGVGTTRTPASPMSFDVLRPPGKLTTSSSIWPLFSSASTKSNKSASYNSDVGLQSKSRPTDSTNVRPSGTRSSSGRESSQEAATSKAMARTGSSTATRRLMRRLTTTTVRTTPLVDQYAAFYAGGNADGPDGPTFEVSNVAGGIDYDSAFRDMPPPQVLPTAIATKIAAAPPALTTRPPPTTRKPPKIVLIANDVVAEIGMSVSQGLKVGCSAKEAWGWTYMAISRYEGDNNFSVEFLGGVEKRDEWPFIPIDSRMSDFTLHRDDEMVNLVLETKFAMCEDKGRYLCEVIVNSTFFTRTFNVDVKKKPEKPVLSFPDDIFAGQTVWITTTWDAGNPMIGHIVHDIVKGFVDLPFVSKNERTTSWYKDCAIMVENKYSVVPEVNWNGTEIIARIEAGPKATALQKSIIERLKFDRKVMVILDANMCQGKQGDKLAHPYNKEKFVTCGSGGPTVEACPELQHFDTKMKKCVLTPVKPKAT